jgi:glycosyltransferase involved in cell wall biosynthesis
VSRLSVVHVYKDVHPPVAGGVEKHIDGLRRTMPDVTSHVLVCSRRPRTSVATVGGAKEVRVGELGPRWMSVPLSPAFPLWLRRIQADLVHVHMPNPVGEASALMTAGTRPIVVSYHADVVRQARFMRAYAPLARACLERAAAVVVGTRGIADTSPLLAGRQVSHVPYGIDVVRYRPEAVSEGERAALRGRYGEPLVLAVARLVYYKGLDHLIAAARQLEAAVVIVGTGPLEARLRAMAARVPNVHLVGALSEHDLIAHMAAADCFVMASTSRAESFGVATLEAQAMGVPAVITDVGSGTLEAIAPGESGLVCAPGSAPALASAIQAVLADPPRARRMGRVGRQRVVAQHSLPEQARRMREVYEEAMRRST